MPNSQIKTLNYPELKAAIEGTAAAFRCVMRLEPAGGPDDKVFPPTYLGGVYAIEKRRIKNANGEGEIVTCVVLDSVQSQANRLEESLLRAYEAKKLRFPLMVVDFSKQEAGSTQTDPEISSVGRITALDAPHRIADAIFRDSVLRANNQTRPFRQSEEGRSFENANIRNATALFELCPTALVFGTWDSTGSRGGLGNKFARTLVSEIIGVRAAVGVRTNSRIDPLGIEKCDLYEDLNGDWTVDLSKAKRNDKGEPIKYGPKGKDKGKPSAINHGNVPPDFPRYSADDAENSTPDALKSSRVELRYDVSGEDGRLSSRSFVQSNEIPIRAGEIKPGGVTIAHALQTSVLSIPGLRRLRFPDGNGKTSAERDNAARTVLAALALAAIAHQREAGWDLRSRCLLIPVDETTPVEIVHSSSSRMPYSMSAADSVALVEEAVRVARENGFKWSDKEIVLWPSNKLVELVQEGRKVAAHVAEGE